jgi:hypothetical protein
MLHCNSTSQDNGTVYSDSDYPSSDIVLRTNDGLRIDLDKDGDGEDADLEIFAKDDTLIFSIDESGALKSAAGSYLWISGNGLRKKNSDDLTKLSLDTFGVWRSTLDSGERPTEM